MTAECVIISTTVRSSYEPSAGECFSEETLRDLSRGAFEVRNVVSVYADQCRQSRLPVLSVGAPNVARWQMSKRIVAPIQRVFRGLRFLAVWMTGRGEQ